MIFLCLVKFFDTLWSISWLLCTHFNGVWSKHIGSYPQPWRAIGTIVTCREIYLWNYPICF